MIGRVIGGLTGGVIGAIGGVIGVIGDVSNRDWLRLGVPGRGKTWNANRPPVIRQSRANRAKHPAWTLNINGHLAA